MDVLRALQAPCSSEWSVMKVLTCGLVARLGGVVVYTRHVIGLLKTGLVTTNMTCMYIGDLRPLFWENVNGELL